jgi:hypothetical protein
VSDARSPLDAFGFAKRRRSGTIASLALILRRDVTPVFEPTFRSYWESGIILTHLQHAHEVSSCPFGRPPEAPSTRCSPAPHPATAAPGTCNTRMIGTERFLPNRQRSLEERLGVAATLPAT